MDNLFRDTRDISYASSKQLGAILDLISAQFGALPILITDANGNNYHFTTIKVDEMGVHLGVGNV
jgi:hypothetical protein